MNSKKPRNTPRFTGKIEVGRCRLKVNNKPMSVVEEMVRAIECKTR